MDLKVFITVLITTLCVGWSYSLSLNTSNSEIKSADPILKIEYVPTKNNQAPTTTSTITQASSTTITTTQAPSTTDTTTQASTTTNTTTQASTTINTTTQASTTTNTTTQASTTTNTTTQAPTKTNTTTQAPPTTSTSTTFPEHSTKTVIIDRQFDGPSFIGGIVLTVGLTAICFIAFKYFRASKVGKEPDYRNL